MPGNRFAFPIRVGREIQFARPAQGPLDLAERLARPVLHLPVHGEIALRLDGAIALLEIADMAVAREYLVARAKILIDGLGLGRGFDDYDIHGHRFGFTLDL